MAVGSYGSERQKAALDNIQSDIAAFAAGYDPGKLTMFFFPGGMGSQLFRDEVSHPSPDHDFDLTWLSCRIVSGDAAKLAMQPDGTDLNSQFVVARGFIDFYIHPYDHLEQWCKSRGIQLFTFGYDWRLSSKESASLFLDGLLPRLDAAIGKVMGSRHPQGNLKNYAFVGHSLGGMVVKLALNRGNDDPYVRGMKSAVTVGTPFYGYGAQLHRFIVGDKQLSWTLSDYQHNNFKMARIICSMPGGYEFVYMSHATYQANDFSQDPDYKLSAYPCLATDGATPADPYEPQDTEDKVYYPLFDDGNKQMLANAALVACAVAKPLDARVAARFYNIRGVQTRHTKVLKNTVVRSIWARSEKTFDPDRHADPVSDFKGPGDGTQPAWGARLLQMHGLRDHVITVPDDEKQLKHMFLMSNAGVQKALARILGVQELFPLDDWNPPPMSTVSEFDTFLRNMPEDSAGKSSTDMRLEVLEYVFSYSRSERRKLAWRVFTDLLSSPGPVKPPGSGRKDRRVRPNADPDDDALEK